MRDSATINEAVDLLESAEWKGYAQAIRELVEENAQQAQEIAILRKERDLLLGIVQGVQAQVSQVARALDSGPAK